MKDLRETLDPSELEARRAEWLEAFRARFALDSLCERVGGGDERV